MRPLLIALLLLSAAVAPAHADRQQDRARAAVEAGEIRPLQDLLARLRGRIDGRVLDVELEEAGRARWVYHIKVLTGDGRVQTMVVDARSGEILRVRGR